VKTPALEALATVFPVKNTAGYRFDIMDGTKKSAVHQSTETEMGRVVDFQVFHRKGSQTS